MKYNPSHLMFPKVQEWPSPSQRFKPIISNISLDQARETNLNALVHAARLISHCWKGCWRNERIESKVKKPFYTATSWTISSPVNSTSLLLLIHFCYPFNSLAENERNHFSGGRQRFFLEMEGDCRRRKEEEGR